MRKPRITLLLLIVALGVLTAMIAFVNALAAAQIVQKEQLIARSLEANRAYAAKLAATVDLYIGSVQRQLEVSASRLPALLSSPQALAAEAARVARQSDGVVAAFVADRDNRVIAFESLAPELTQKPAMLSRVEIDQREVAGHVSAVYLSADGFPIVLFSQPIRDAAGSYLGLLGAVIFLQQDNELDRLVSVHFHHDGSNVYVVDSGGKVLVHQDKSRIGTNESGNVVVDALGRGEAGAVAVTGTRGKRYFAGYAPMRSGKWGVVVQTPEAVTLEPQRDLLRRALLYSVPAAALTLLLIYVLARGIAHPLSQLAQAMRRDDGGRDEKPLRGLRPWYYEAQQLREAVCVTLAQHRRRITQLNTETHTDPMTRLMNRRGMEGAIERLMASHQPFSVLALDIDRFKRVNDTYGHAAGDKVLMTLADLLRAVIRTGDLPCRIGGEEFLVLMPAGNPRVAQLVAARIRAAVANTHMPDGVGCITISIGVARWPHDNEDVCEVLKSADQALYAAKKAGGDRVVVYPF